MHSHPRWYLAGVHSLSNDPLQNGNSGSHPNIKSCLPTHQVHFRRHNVPEKLMYYSAPHDSPSTEVTLTAVDGRQILLLEELDHMLNELSCSFDSTASRDVINLGFTDAHIFEVASGLWSTRQDLAIITSHLGCNPSDERGAWMYVLLSYLLDI